MRNIGGLFTLMMSCGLSCRQPNPITRGEFDNNACESLYSVNTASSGRRAEYDKIADSVYVGAEITWSAQWSYLPPGWTCTAKGKVDGRGTVVGVIHPSEKNTIPVLLGLAIAAGGIATSVYSVILSVQRVRHS